jgi:hypothetical protein
MDPFWASTYASSTKCRYRVSQLFKYCEFENKMFKLKQNNKARS